MHEIIIAPQAKKELKKLPRRYKEAVSEAILEIRTDPFISGKPLTRDFTGKYSYKVGAFRTIYKINKKDKIVYVLTAGHRSRVYK